jgi:hypothetical protein
VRLLGRGSAFVTVGLIVLVSAAAAAGPAVSFAGARRAYQGKPYTVTLGVKKAAASCTLAVKYKDGALQSGLTGVPVSGGKATFRWTVPQLAAPGPASLTARCGSSTAKRGITVVGTFIPPKIVVVKSGYSVRQWQLGSTVSYGVVLKNTSPNANALNVSMQVNFVMADSHLVGTATQPIPLINAGSTYNYAGSLAFPGAAPVAKLEFVIIVGAREKSKKVPNPSLANVAWIPQQFDPIWTGWVQGEVINSHPSYTLKNTQLSAVLFDAQGKVLGGATGSAYNVLPPGTRQVFKLASAVDAIPYAKIASVDISLTPSWETPAP